MADQENLYYKLKFEVENLNSFLQKIREAQGAITNSSRTILGNNGFSNAPNPSGSQSPIAQSAKDAIDGFQNNPKLKQDLQEINNLIGGMGMVTDNKTRGNMVSQIRRHYADLSKEIVMASNNLNRELEARGIATSSRNASIEKAAAPYLEGMANAEDIIKQDVANTNPHSKRMMRAIGMYVMAGLINQVSMSAAEYYKSSMMVGAQNEVATGMGFNFGSIQGFQQSKHEAFLGNQMRDAQLAMQGKTSMGQAIGTMAGIGVGGLLSLITGGAALPLMGTMGMIGSMAGSQVGSIMGTKDISELMVKQLPVREMDKAVGEFMQIANTFEKAWTGLDIAKTRFSARSDGGRLTGRGYGYSDEKLSQLATMQIGATGHYDEGAFRSELAFSRAHGYDPSEIFQASVMTRYTGQEIGAKELYSRQNVANLTGMGNRMPELLQALNNLAVTMTKSGAVTNEDTIRQASLIPYGIWGDTARGRLGDLGMDTLGQINGMFNQQMGSAGDVFLYNALRGQTGGDLWKFQLAKERGAFDFENIKSVFEMAKSSTGNNPMLMKQTLHGLMKGMSANMSEQLVNQAENFKGEEGEGMEGWLKHLEKLSEDTEEQKKFMSDLDQEAKKNTSGSEKFYASYENSLAYPGGGVAKDVRKIMMQQLEMQKAMVKDSEVWDSVKKYFDLERTTFLDEMRRIIKDWENYIKENKNFTERENKNFTESEGNWIYNYVQAGKNAQKFKWGNDVVLKAIQEGKGEIVSSNKIGDYYHSFYMPLLDKEGNVQTDENGKDLWFVPKNGMDLGDGQQYYQTSDEERDAMKKVRDDFDTRNRKRKVLSTGSNPPSSQGDRDINLNISLDASSLESLDTSLANIRRRVIDVVGRAKKAQERAEVGLIG